MLDLRFIEKVGEERSVQEIEKFPCTIGKSRSSNQPPPYHYSSLISGDAISNIHCSVKFDYPTNTWDITDGDGVKPSTNGIHYSAREDIEMVRVDRVTIQFEGDRVYLMRLQTGSEAFLEVYDPGKANITLTRQTQDIDPTLLKLKEFELKLEQSDKNYEEGIQRGRVRDARIDNLEATAESLGGILIKVDTNRVQVLRGSFVALLMVLILLPIGFIGGLIVAPEKVLDTMYQLKGLIHPSKAQKEIK